MQAAVVPAVSSSWQVKDVPQPQPGPNQVLVKMRASGICYTDVHQTLGHLPGSFPRILGHEPVGEIVAVAPDVTTRVRIMKPRAQNYLTLADVLRDVEKV